jgi:hypothetical protein
MEAIHLRNVGLSPNYMALNPKDRTLHSHRCEALKTNMVRIFLMSSQSVKKQTTATDFFSVSAWFHWVANTIVLSLEHGLHCSKSLWYLEITKPSGG